MCTEFPQYLHKCLICSSANLGYATFLSIEDNTFCLIDAKVWNHPDYCGGTMKKMRDIILPIVFLMISVPGVAADVNGVLNFTNYTDEELYVELFVYDNCCTRIYDLYVRPYRTSIAEFWSDSIHATYSACAYGEITGDYYGCMQGGVADYNNNIYFDASGDPYLSTPSDLPAEVFTFANPYHRDHFESRSHYHADVGCFIDTLSF
jgi:hypothetical protein